jgi:hypothetical protein
MIMPSEAIGLAPGIAGVLAPFGDVVVCLNNRRRDYLSKVQEIDRLTNQVEAMKTNLERLDSQLESAPCDLSLGNVQGLAVHLKQMESLFVDVAGELDDHAAG